ncbi:DnaJ domain-containing protein [Syncephalis fuscata]|nr:DnaJ domain-containing protein [Syncephalis fuscata]
MEETCDYFALLEVTADADERAIRSAYRSKALRYHPDKNPNDHAAAKIFLKLTKAYEALKDPETRRKYLNIHAARHKRTQRTAAMDSERQRMKELEEREEDVKRQKTEAKQEEARMWAEVARLQADAARLEREQHEREESARVAAANKAAASETVASKDTDTTLKVRCKLKKQLFTEESLTKLFGHYGELEHVLISTKKKKSALVAFKTINGAHAAMTKADLPDSPLEPFTLSWAGGEEPALVQQLKQTPPASGLPKESGESNKTTGVKSFSFTSAPKLSSNDYETLTLMRMRQAERARLEAKIRAEEAEENTQ